MTFEEFIKDYIGDPAYKEYKYFFAGKRFYLENVPIILHNATNIKTLVDQFNYEVHVKLEEESEYIMRYTLKDFIEDDLERARHFIYEVQGERYNYEQISHFNILMSSDILVDYLNFIVKIR